MGKTKKEKTELKKEVDEKFTDKLIKIENQITMARIQNNKKAIDLLEKIKKALLEKKQGHNY